MSTLPIQPGPAGKSEALAFYRRVYYGRRAVCIFSFTIPTVPRVSLRIPDLT